MVVVYDKDDDGDDDGDSDDCVMVALVWWLHGSVFMYVLDEPHKTCK